MARIREPEPPPRRSDEAIRARALERLVRLKAKADTVATDRTIGIKLAHSAGASLREIAEADGRSHMTIKRIIETRGVILDDGD